ncbi:MAG TPA: pyridoxal-phosphate dependent enzyme, partial [Armatimonadota bacterium]|nr:pyridoxal-phosphate dependent enzyme [Armatimonadota bacterium]
ADPHTLATAIKIGNPASWTSAVAARDASGGLIDMVTDEEILAAYTLLASREGVFVEPASAASIAGVLTLVGRGYFPAEDGVIVCTVTGHGLKDPDNAITQADPVSVVPAEMGAILQEIGI